MKAPEDEKLHALLFQNDAAVRESRKIRFSYEHLFDLLFAIIQNNKKKYVQFIRARKRTLFKVPNIIVFEF